MDIIDELGEKHKDDYKKLAEKLKPEFKKYPEVFSAWEQRFLFNILKLIASNQDLTKRQIGSLAKCYYDSIGEDVEEVDMDSEPVDIRFKR